MAYTEKPYVKQPYERKVWDNVPDPSNYEGNYDLNSLPRYDAENMNRIEDGIEEALNLTADDVGAVGIGDNVVVGKGTSSDTTKGGVRFGIMYTEKGVPMVGMGTERGSNAVILTSGCDYTNEAKKAEIGQVGYYFPVELAESTTSFPTALKVSNYDGKAYLLRSSTGKKHYAKNELIPMSEYEVLHTGNKSLIVPNDIMALSLGGGTEIKGNDDLNSYTTIGNYACPISDRALTLSNCPIKSAFIMTVGYAAGRSSNIYQEIREYVAGTRYYRLYIASTQTWSEWQSTYGTANSPIVTGTYTGTGGKQTIDLGVRPKAVLITDTTYGSTFMCPTDAGLKHMFGGLVIDGQSTHYGGLYITENGFVVDNTELGTDSTYGHIYINYTGEIRQYIAWI